MGNTLNQIYSRANAWDEDSLKRHLGTDTLAGQDLRGFDLSNARLTRADLSGTDLREANLSGTDFTGADLTGAFIDLKSIEKTTLWGGAKLNNVRLWDECFLSEEYSADIIDRKIMEQLETDPCYELGYD